MQTTGSPAVNGLNGPGRRKSRSSQALERTLPGRRTLRVVGLLLAWPVLMLSVAVAPALARNPDSSAKSSPGPLVCDYAPNEMATALADLNAGMSLAEACAQTGSTLTEGGEAILPTAATAVGACNGAFSGSYTHGSFYQAKGKLQWSYYFNVDTQLTMLGDVSVTMPSAFIDGDGINPPYQLHVRNPAYDFHSSILKYQAFGVSGTRKIKTGEVLQMNWEWTFEDTNGAEAEGGSGVECSIPSGF